mmetsp:Transcript_44625/g.113022  ORF Transcript_44625/g.113022 Transcript_44625/m.113022 type:complete len:214 (-) Transcript_44625:249-890(-)
MRGLLGFCSSEQPPVCGISRARVVRRAANQVIPEVFNKVAEAWILVQCHGLQDLLVLLLWPLPNAVTRCSKARTLSIVQDLIERHLYLHVLLPERKPEPQNLVLVGGALVRQEMDQWCGLPSTPLVVGCAAWAHRRPGTLVMDLLVPARPEDGAQGFPKAIQVDLGSYEEQNLGVVRCLVVGAGVVDIIRKCGSSQQVTALFAIIPFRRLLCL